jgi:hypothetical protein
MVVIPGDGGAGCSRGGPPKECRRPGRLRSKEGDVNSVQLIGRLATDIDIKEVTGGSAPWRPS